MAQSLAEQAAALLTASGFGAAVLKLFDVWQTSRGRKAAEPAAITEANAELLQAFSPAVRDLLVDYRNQLHFVRGQQEAQAAEISALQREHATCRSELAEVKRELEDRMAAHRLEIEVLMAAHPPAEYGPQLLAGLVPPRQSEG